MNDFERSEKVWNNLDYETKLNVALFIGTKLVEHAREGGSYRYLIYDKLGFGMDAYEYLLDTYMTISNEFILVDLAYKNSNLDVEMYEYIEQIPTFLTPEDKINVNVNPLRKMLLEFYYRSKEAFWQVEKYRIKARKQEAENEEKYKLDFEDEQEYSELNKLDELIVDRDDEDDDEEINDDEEDLPVKEE